MLLLVTNYRQQQRAIAIPETDPRLTQKPGFSEKPGFLISVGKSDRSTGISNDTQEKLEKNCKWWFNRDLINQKNHNQKNNLTTNEDPRKAYWRANRTLIGILLAVWALVSLVFSILLVQPLNAITFFGVPFGFWMAQQGSIYVFVALIFIYAIQMDTKGV